MPADSAPFPVALHGVSVADSLAALDRLFKADVDPARVAAIIVEPVQGEGGFYEAPRDFMTALRKICDQHGMLLIADEVQTGFARTGKMFAMDHHEVAPDITTMAKSLAGADSAGRSHRRAPVDGRAEHRRSVAPMAAARSASPPRAVLDVIDEEKLCDRANTLGAAR
jgi:4-aminobutyrate aminotransferase